MKENIDFKALVKNLRDGAISINERSQIVYVNQSASEIFGYSQSEMIGMILTELMPEKFRDLHRGGMKRFLTTGEAKVIGKVVELEGLKKNGAIFPIELSISQAHKTKEGYIFTALIRDITERKKISEKLAALGRLTGAIAHEIRNPLTSLMGSAYYLKLFEKEIENKEIIKHLNLINKQVALVDQIISNLLDFARVKEPKRQSTDMVALLQKVAAEFSPPENVRVNIQAATPLPALRVDPMQIRQIFGNLIINAYQAMPKGGELKIRMDYSQGPLQIIFEDSGVGIPKENLDKIFEPLFSTRPKGTGLGLAIVKQLIEKNGGFIGVESTHGKGTKFVLSFS